MKINGLPEIFRFMNRVQERPDGQFSQGEERRESKDQKKDDESRRATPEEVNQAIASFQADPQTKDSGLIAESVGGGPGLKVVLKDGGGAVVRQYTGEEFLKLREAATQGGGTASGSTRGKILDQKF